MGCMCAGAVPQECHAWERAGTPRYMCAPVLVECGTLPDEMGRDGMGWDGMVT